MSRGRLRIYLGAAPGVGKTYAMLSEGNRRAERGGDVVIGWVETHGREHTAGRIGVLDAIPPLKVDYRGAEFFEMNTEAILARCPDIVLIDELAHTNVPGSRFDKRWQDVEEVLDAGIDVISTLNVQHLESVNDVVEQITGVRQQETVPDWVVRSAEQVELVDMTAEALRRRMAHGNIYPATKIDAALANYFRPGNLEALRELALLWVADRIDLGLASYREQHGIDRTWETRERVVVAVTGSVSGEHLIRRAARMAQRGRGDLVGVHIRSTDGRVDSAIDQLEAHRQLIADLGGAYHEIVAEDPVAALVAFAQEENATQLVLGASRRSRTAELFRGSVINSVIRSSGSVDVHVISSRTRSGDAAGTGGQRRGPRRNEVPFSPRRRVVGWLTATLGPLAVTSLLANTRTVVGQGVQFLLYLVVVLVAAAAGGAAPAVLAAVVGALLLNWFFTEPHYTFSVADADNIVALLVFVVVGVIVGLFVTAFVRRTMLARRANLEAEALARVAAGLVAAEDPIPAMLERIRSTLMLAGIEVLGLPADGRGQATEAGDTSGTPDSSLRVGDATIELYGEVHAEDRRLLEVFGSQLCTAMERRRLQRQAAAAAGLEETDALRTALLRAVSHDLRTPLATIKASVSSLLQPDIEWPTEQRDEFLTTIEEQTDRLNRVIGDLLDASRLEVGAIAPMFQPVAVEEVLASALADLGASGVEVRVAAEPDLPLVTADPGLLVRALANLVGNAVSHSPPDRPPTIAAEREDGGVQIRVIDHGVGVDPAARESAFQPFQRLGDTMSRPGVGLGLHVAKGFVDALHGQIDLEETAGGGLTVVLRLPRAETSTAAALGATAVNEDWIAP